MDKQAAHRGPVSLLLWRRPRSFRHRTTACYPTRAAIYSRPSDFLPNETIEINETMAAFNPEADRE